MIIQKQTHAPQNHNAKEVTHSKKLRVAAYCRVSTLAEEQDLSYESQKQYYKNRFENDENCVLIGIYGDHGLSGLRSDKRPGFQKLITDCRNGMIDEIFTKSISRFGRNFSECLQYLRELRNLGVVVHFEKENLSTIDRNIDMYFTILAIAAQEESNSISQNLIWAIDQRAKAGDPVRGARYGYWRDSEPTRGVHIWHVLPDEALRVRKIYSLFLSGNYSMEKIAGIMNDFELKNNGFPNWTFARIKGILISEVYVGDLITRKTYVADYLQKKIRINNGEREQILIKNHHKAIISRSMDKKVKQKLNGRIPVHVK